MAHFARLARPPLVRRWHFDRDSVLSDSNLCAMPWKPRSVTFFVSYRQSSCRLVSFPRPFRSPLSVTFVTTPKLRSRRCCRPATGFELKPCHACWEYLTKLCHCSRTHEARTLLSGVRANPCQTLRGHALHQTGISMEKGRECLDPNQIMLFFVNY